MSSDFKDDIDLKAKGDLAPFDPDAYMELPLDGDDRPLHLCDRVTVDGEPEGVFAVESLHSDGFVTVHDGSGICPPLVVDPSCLHRAGVATQAFDASGRPCLPGERVWPAGRLSFNPRRCSMVIESIPQPGVLSVLLGDGLVTVRSEKVTHDDPAGFWDDLERDAALGVDAYRARYRLSDDGGMSWPQAVRLDLVRRARAFAGLYGADGDWSEVDLDESIKRAVRAASSAETGTASSSGSSPCRERMIELEGEISQLKRERSRLVEELWSTWIGNVREEPAPDRAKGGRHAHER